MAVVFNVPWYATGFRGDAFEAALKEIAPVALRYGASDWAVYRSSDDRYKFQQIATFEDSMQLRRCTGTGPSSRRSGARLLGLVPGAGPLLPDDARRVAARASARQTESSTPTRQARAEAIRAGQPCSSGAIVSPASLSCSQ